MILRQPCRYDLKGTCTRSPCEYWHPPDCQFYKTESGCKAGDKCRLPHCKRLTNNQKKSRNKLPFTKVKPQRRQKCSGYCEICTSVGLSLARLGAIGFSKRKTASEKPDAKSLGPIRRIRYATSSKYLEEERTIAWKSSSQNSSSQKSLRCEI